MADPGFTADRVVLLSYYDRVEDRIARAPFRRVHFEKGEHFSFAALEGGGPVHMVPQHCKAMIAAESRSPGTALEGAKRLPLYRLRGGTSE